MLLCQPYINYSELFITLITYFSLPPKLMIDSDKQDRCKIPCRFKPVVLNFIQIWICFEVLQISLDLIFP